MEFLYNYGLFLAKSLTVLVVLLVAFAGILALKKQTKSKLETECLNDVFNETKNDLTQEIKNVKPTKLSRQAKREQSKKPTLFLIDFEGDLKASGVEGLRDLITAVLSVATAKDEVVIRLESPGGSVNGYGLAASQLQRIRDRGLFLTVCIDKVAASGGYLMACVANMIVAAPFAIVGSIGVVAQLPNFHRFLKKHDVDVELLTAGEFKRTLTMFAENDAKGRRKFQEEIEHIHGAFKNFVLQNRPQLDMAKVSTGEHWLAIEAFEFRLVDVIKTSDDYLIEKMSQFNVYCLSSPEKRSLLQRLIKPAMSLFSPWG
ncbi:MAG: protease SohB [Gammaproteobacteria bacterium]|nr:protease SohB [Gammaproteobacteria bacterium]